MAYITKGLTLEYAANNPYSNEMVAYWEYATTKGIVSGEQMILPGLQEVGEIALAGAGGSYDQIEVTTLADHKHQFVDGLMAEADTSGGTIDFKFLYDPALFDVLNKTAKLELAMNREGSDKWIVAIPNGGEFTITGEISSIKLDTASVNSALTFVLTLAVRDITHDSRVSA